MSCDHKKSYFSGGFRKPKYEGYEVLKCEVLKHSYGAKLNRHTFTLKVLEVIETSSKYVKIMKECDVFRIRGKNLYPNLRQHEIGAEAIECIGNLSESDKKLFGRK